MPFVSARSALQLTEEELEYINRASKSRTLPESAVERAKILLEYYERKSISQIARDLGTNRPKVERTIDKAFAYGIYAALEDLPRSGRPRKISSGARTWILSLACSKPLDHGYPYELWTQRLLAEHIRSHCLDNGFPELSKLSRGTVSKILGASNVKPHKISSYLAPIDPEFEPKSIVVLHTYKQVELLQQMSKENKPLDMVIISYDEKPGIQAIENKYVDLMPALGKYATLSRDYESVAFPEYLPIDPCLNDMLVPVKIPLISNAFSSIWAFVPVRLSMLCDIEAYRDTGFARFPFLRKLASARPLYESMAPLAISV